MSRRIGAYKEGISKGMTPAEARRYSDWKHPPTYEDMEYEEMQRRKDGVN
jgi:hypothetical protein